MILRDRFENLFQFILFRLGSNNYFLKKSRNVLYFDSNRLKQVRRRKLKKVLWEAVNYVPYYRSMKLNIDWKNFTEKELDKFPIVDKQTILDNLENFRSERRSGIINSTSGSSGAPFKFRVNSSNLLEESINYLRSLIIQGYKYKYGDPVIVVRSYVPEDSEPVIKLDKRYNYWYISPFHISDNTISDIYNFILLSGAKVMRGYPSSLNILTDVMRRNELYYSGIMLISTSSEMLFDSVRANLESFWKASVLDYYGHNENVIAIGQCKDGQYHNNEDYGLVEVIGGDIIGTSLRNLAMPFIRYRTNDKAYKSESWSGICSCGITHEVVFSGVLGRNDDVLYKGDGSAVSTANFSTAFKDLTSISSFQFIQYDKSDIEIRLVVRREDKEEIEMLIKRFKQRMGSDVKYRLTYLDNIDRDESSHKIKTTIQILNNDVGNQEKTV